MLLVIRSKSELLFHPAHNFRLPRLRFRYIIYNINNLKLIQVSKVLSQVILRYIEGLFYFQQGFSLKTGNWICFISGCICLLNLVKQ